MESYARIFIGQESFVEIIYVGQITESMVSMIVEDANRIVDQIQGEGKPPHFLVNVNDMDRTSRRARKAGLDWIRKGRAKKIAVYGRSLANKYLINLMAKAIGWQRRFKYFDSREDAVAWLRFTKQR